MRNDYYALSSSKNVLVADGTVFAALIAMNRMNLLTDIYEKIYTTPEIYSLCQRSLDIESLKTFRSLVTQIEFSVGSVEIDSIRELSASLTDDDACAMLYGMVEKTDVVMDDPVKAKIFSSHSVKVKRLTDIVSAAALTKKQNPA